VFKKQTDVILNLFSILSFQNQRLVGSVWQLFNRQQRFTHEIHVPAHESPLFLQQKILIPTIATINLLLVLFGRSEPFATTDPTKDRIKKSRPLLIGPSTSIKIPVGLVSAIEYIPASLRPTP
jgi:hypothetical protein